MKQIALLFLLSVAAIVSAKPGDNAATGKGDTIQLPTYKGAYPYDVITFKPFLMTVGPNYVTGAPSWDGKGLHVGVQSGGYELTSDVVERDFVAPESSSLVFQAIDMYGDTAMSVTTKAVQEYFTDLQDFGLAWGQNKDALILGSTIMRGGSYQINLSVVPDIFILTDTMDVKDEAGIRIAPFESKLGMDVDFLAHITTGYPYNPDTLTGNETLRWVVSRMNSDSTYTTILEGNKKLRLKDTAKPLLAGLDSMAFRLEKPRVGRYKIDFTSDFPAANITTAFDVQDTLRATFQARP